MSDARQKLEELLAQPLTKKKRPVVEPPKAEVIPLPQGQALTVAKSERTRVAEIERAIEREKAWEAERLRRAEALVNSEAYAAAGERFNREYHHVDDGPCHFGNPGGWR
jgi:hypothetical protein